MTMIKPARKTVLILLCLAGIISPLVSCSRAEPQITYGFIALTYYQERTKPEERFSFFIIPEDEDGIENLAELYLFHDREQLRWLVTSDDWVSYTHDGKTWIGSRSLAIGEDQTLPRGQYRAVLVNKGGERSERNFSFDAPEEPRFPFPTLEIAGGRYTVNSAYPENRLVCYDEQGNYVATVNLSALSGNAGDLGLPSNARSAALWAEDALYFTSAFTDVTAFH
ncbi:MAG: hypothetical protein LBD48_04115 [Treponema sp.]|jgi:hypothetical protein|nr:hypothetical protein [Treponema sp.]